jgi:hypothetical protein
MPSDALHPFVERIHGLWDESGIQKFRLPLQANKSFHQVRVRQRHPGAVFDTFKAYISSVGTDHRHSISRFGLDSWIGDSWLRRWSRQTFRDIADLNIATSNEETPLVMLFYAASFKLNGTLTGAGSVHIVPSETGRKLIWDAATSPLVEGCLHFFNRRRHITR